MLPQIQYNTKSTTVRSFKYTNMLYVINNVLPKVNLSLNPTFSIKHVFFHKGYYFWIHDSNTADKLAKVDFVQLIQGKCNNYKCWIFPITAVLDVTTLFYTLMSEKRKPMMRRCPMSSVWPRQGHLMHLTSRPQEYNAAWISTCNGWKQLPFKEVH